MDKIEITRSFSFKLNLGNYQMADFFCSQKAECRPEEAEKVSEALYLFCKTEVIKSVNEYRNINSPENKKANAKAIRADKKEKNFEAEDEINIQN